MALSSFRDWLRARRDRRAAIRQAAAALYEAALAAARHPDFYRHYDIPDTFVGRFELLALHLGIVMRRLQKMQDAHFFADLAQALYDRALRDMDPALRQMGIGDLGIAKRMRRLAEGLNGRFLAYGRALEGADDSALIAALNRNLFGTRATPPAPAILTALAAHLRQLAAWAESCPDAAWRTGRLSFPAIGGATLS